MAKPTNGFKEGKDKTGGRSAGVANRATRILKEAAIIAAECEGFNGRGMDGLVGYLRRAARDEMPSFLALLGRIIPTQVETRGDVNIEVTYRSSAEVIRELESRGISLEVINKFLNTPPPLIEQDDVEVVEERETA